jgi:hypothetical protein
MPFFIYKTAKLPNGALRYHEPKPVSLAGGSLIPSTCKRFLGHEDVGWRIGAADLLRTGGYDPENHAVVIDTAPGRPTVSLFEINSIIGYSYANWTPIMLVFEQLFVDEEVSATPDEIKQAFTDEACERCVVRSILYLMGGYVGGDWNWGGNSRTTAALLWSDAWTFFQAAQVGAGGT